jgi:hypothetical protein
LRFNRLALEVSGNAPFWGEREGVMMENDFLKELDWEAVIAAYTGDIDAGGSTQVYATVQAQRLSSITPQRLTRRALFMSRIPTTTGYGRLRSRCGSRRRQMKEMNIKEKRNMNVGGIYITHDSTLVGNAHNTTAAQVSI